MRSLLTPAARQGLSVALATGLYGVSFGAVSVAAGLTLLQTCLLSLLMFSGGSQFALVGVLGAGGGGPAAVASAGLLGIRNGIYGLQVAPLLEVRGPTKVLAAQVTIDESAAVALAQTDPAEQRRGFWVTGIGIYVFWNLTTLGGGLLGDALGDPRRFGLDGAAVAAFLALLWPRLRSGQAWAVGAVAALVAVVATPAVPAGVPVLLAAVAAGVVGLVQDRRRR